MFINSRLLIVYSVVVLLLCASIGNSYAQQDADVAVDATTEATADDALIEMNFRNVQMLNFLTAMSEAFDMAFLWNEQDIRGSISLVSPKKFSKDEAFGIFQTILTLYGYAMVEQEGDAVIQILPIDRASRVPGPTEQDFINGNHSSRFITQIIPLAYADANQVRATLANYISQGATMTVYTPANVIILTDVESNINRVIKLSETLDTEPEDTEYRIFKLNYVQAQKMASILLPLAQGTIQSGRPNLPKPVIVPEEQSNSLIIVANNYFLEKFREIIRFVDVPSGESSGMEVFRLEHADAESLVSILKSADIPTDAGAQGSASPVKLNITADKLTNSVVVFAQPGQMKTIIDMIKQLDVPRSQVFVEALIMEMTVEQGISLGVTWNYTGLDTRGNLYGGGAPNASPTTASQGLASAASSVIGVLGNAISYNGQSFASFGAFIHASQGDQNLKVLANPQILTMNNEQAKINVSQVVPVSAKTVTDSNQQTTVEYTFKDIGIILSIVPQITGNNKVRLLIEQESSTVAARNSGVSTSNAITTLKRSLNTKVVVENNATIAIGGLIQDQEVIVEDKVPCLGDIPLLGHLFKTSRTEKRKTNLVVFIRPRIITTAESINQVSQDVQRKYNSVQGPDADSQKILVEDFDLDVQILGENAEESTE